MSRRREPVEVRVSGRSPDMCFDGIARAEAEIDATVLLRAWGAPRGQTLAYVHMHLSPDAAHKLALALDSAATQARKMEAEG